MVRLPMHLGSSTWTEYLVSMRAMPRWGRDKVRRFWQDTSMHKKLAARDYKAYLIVSGCCIRYPGLKLTVHCPQVIIPAIDGLLPPRDNKIVIDMLFELANWYLLAKLRMHHDVTLENMEHATKHMYEAVKTFAATTCLRHTAMSY